MDSNSQYELYLIKKELQDVVNELLNISNGVRLDFSGVGNDKCADTLVRAANHYMEVRMQLDKMNLSELSDEFKAKKLAQDQREAAKRAEEKKKAASVPKPVPATSAPAPTPAKSSSKSKTSSSKKKNQSAVSVIEEALAWLFK